MSPALTSLLRLYCLFVCVCVLCVFLLAYTCVVFLFMFVFVWSGVHDRCWNTWFDAVHTYILPTAVISIACILCDN